MNGRTTKSIYAIIPANVRYDKDLAPNAKLLYGEITALCNEKGYCWASNQYFAELYHVSDRTIKKWVSQLVDKGYIVRMVNYKEGTKEIEHRKLFIGGENKFTTPGKNVHYPQENKFTTPGEEKFPVNNKDINNTFNNKQYCQSFMDEANITRVYLTKYDTTSLKSKIKTDESDDISRAFELYVNYMPTFTNSAASKTGYNRIIVEIKHDNVD